MKFLLPTKGNWLQSLKIFTHKSTRKLKKARIYFFLLKYVCIKCKNKTNSNLCVKMYIYHGCIIKWTQHIGFLTLAGMARVVEGNHGNNSKEG